MNSICWRVTLVALVAGALGGCTKQKNLYDLELEAAESMVPEQTFSKEKKAATATIQPLTIAVYVAQDCYRRHSCKGRIRDIIKRASRHVEREFAITFSYPALQRWEPKHTPGDLPAALIELQQMDGGQQGDWVVGIVSGEGLAKATRHGVGLAVRMGKHFVMALRDTPEEWNELKAQYQTLSHTELGRVYEKRRIHREVSVFLHEWGHSLGALHATDPHFFMFPMHEFVSDTFGPGNADLIMLGLKMRAKPGDYEAEMAWKKAVLERLSKTTRTGWDPRDQELLRQALYAEVVEGKIILQQADVEPFNEAVALAQKGKIRAAWALLEPMLPRYAGNPKIHHFACQLAKAHRPRKRSLIKQHCRKR